MDLIVTFSYKCDLLWLDSPPLTHLPKWIHFLNEDQKGGGRKKGWGQSAYWAWANPWALSLALQKYTNKKIKTERKIKARPFMASLINKPVWLLVNRRLYENKYSIKTGCTVAECFHHFKFLSLKLISLCLSKTELDQQASLRPEELSYRKVKRQIDAVWFWIDLKQKNIKWFRWPYCGNWQV